MPRPTPSETLVVFEDRTDSRWLRWLKPGYRHCYCLMRADRGWILIDPLLRDLRIAWLDLPDNFDLVQHHVALGRVVLHGSAAPRPSRAPLIQVVTCVEMVKRSLGLAGLRAWTPRQLHDVLIVRGWRRHGLA